MKGGGSGDGVKGGGGGDGVKGGGGGGGRDESEGRVIPPEKQKMCPKSPASSKPKDITFISGIATQLCTLMQDGLEWMGRSLSVEVRCVTCNTPAKAMVRCVKLFSGYYGCNKCNQKGAWDGRMLYPEMNSLTLRTNQSFRECWQPEHHHESISPFCSLPIDMVHSFPADYMHQCCLGVMEKLLLLWTRGKTEVRQTPECKSFIYTNVASSTINN